MNNSVPQAIDPAKEFESLITRFQSLTSEAKDISDKLYEKTNRLIPFGLDCDQEKGVDRPPSEGVIGHLIELSDKLSYINRRNQEIVRHLNSMV